MKMNESLLELRKFVDLIEGRAMACDGPVTPFLEELEAASQCEKGRFTDILRSLYSESLKPKTGAVDALIWLKEQMIEEQRIGVSGFEDWIKVIEAALTAAPASAVEPVGWVFELAQSLDQTTGEYCNWGPPQFSFTEPCVPEKAIRNLRPVYYGS